MIKDYHFKDIEKYLKKSTDIGEDILDAFDKLSDAAIIFSPIVFGPQFLPLLELLDVKDRLINLGHKVYDFIMQKVELDYIERTEQIHAAYALICYTAYFDVLQDALPKNIRKKLKLKLEEKKEIIENAIESADALLTSSPHPNIHCNVFYADHVTSFSEIKEKLADVYNCITNGLLKMVEDSSIFNESIEQDQQEFKKFKDILEKLPQSALRVYEAQYLNLAEQFEDFALFAQLQNFNGIHQAIKQNKNILDLFAADITKRIDVGFNKLNDIVNSISINYSAIQAQEIVDDLKKKYLATIEEPIIDDKEIKSDTETIRLSFPRIVDAFIPQSYKCLSYQQKETKLEDISVWKDLPIQYDLDNFFIKYLYSPDSIDYPLIILGQPGSGKSLLTKVLSAQLMSDSYTVIRIPLREVNAEDGIDVLVEDQIKKLTNRSLYSQGYGGFAAQFNEKPLIIILDGYDELLQAKGNVFSGYLENVRAFQQNQKSMKRPVRIIITSRITLIDKARVPVNSTILRLMEFNQQQRQAWTNIWNDINANYFINSEIKPFSLDIKEKEKKNKIIELAEQPLLLLMLALYDSEANELAQTSSIKRTELYENLLRRFVRRERRRYVSGFADKTSKEQEEIIDQEMNRLGVVAIGMYNRQEVVILSRQLEADLDVFKVRRNDGISAPHTLKESESVLGGFFFIHKSTAQDTSAHSDNSESAYEFLHNTFGEFLAADFILRNMINEVKDIYVDRKFKSASLTNKLLNPDALNSGWFYCLMFVPLYSRPVIIEMLREHATKALQRALQIYDIPIDITQHDFIENLKFLVQNQLKMILNTRSSPSVMRNGIISDRDIPLIGYLSTYSLNLIILACTLSPNGFEFNEEEYRHSEARELDSKPWDKLSSLWKAWFSPADLMGLSVILKAQRKNDTVVHIKCNEKFEATRYEQPIDILLCISSTLADNLLTGLSGLQTQQFCAITRMSDKDICEMLKEESSDLYFSYLISLLRKKMNEFSYEPHEFRINCEEINGIIESIIHDNRIHHINQNTLLNFFETLECCLLRNVVFFSTRKDLVKSLPHLINGSRVYLKKNSKSPVIVGAVQLLQLLLKDTNHLILNEKMIYDEYLSKNTFIDKKWVEEVERILYYSSYYTKNNRMLIQGLDASYTYLESVLDEVERSSTMTLGDRAKILKQLVESNNLEILIKTNPELLTRSILMLLQSNDVNMVINLQNIINIVLKECLQQLSSIGISYFGFKAIINMILIARYSKESSFLIDIKKFLHRQLFGRRFEKFGSIIYVYPTFVANLIDVIPEIFADISNDTLEFFFLEKKIQHIKTKKIFDYINVFRKIYQLTNEDSKCKKTISNILYKFVSHLYESANLRKIDFNEISVSQLDDLMWYADFANDKSISILIKEMMHKLFEY